MKLTVNDVIQIIDYLELSQGHIENAIQSGNNSPLCVDGLKNQLSGLEQLIERLKSIEI